VVLDEGTRSTQRHIAMKDRIVTPPALPVISRPRAADRAEHIPPHNPGATFLKAAGGKVVVKTSLTVLLAKEMVRHIPEFPVVHPLERARAGRTTPSARAADAEGMIEALARARAVTIQRNAGAVNRYFLHV
jgi:hypothetical protein